MLDVARYGHYGGKLRLLCQCWYVWSTWTKQNWHCNFHYDGNSYAYRTAWRDCLRQLHLTSWGIFETIITRRPFPRRISCLYLTIMSLPLLYTSIDPCKETWNIVTTYCKSRDSGKPLQLAATHSRIHLECNEQVGCHLFHSDLKLTIYSSGLPTSFHYHLPLLSHPSKSWLNQHLSQVRVDPDQADRQALRPLHHSLAHRNNADSS